MSERKSTDFIVVHCSATRPSLDIGRDTIREWHIAKGWADIGYAAVIRRDGTIQFGRGFDEIGAHVAGFNSRSVGICLVGGLYEDGSEADDDFPGLFTERQAYSLADVLQVLKLAYPASKICGHRDLSPDSNQDGKITRNEWLKTCPGFDVASWCVGKGIGGLT